MPPGTSTAKAELPSSQNDRDLQRVTDELEELEVSEIIEKVRERLGATRDVEEARAEKKAKQREDEDAGRPRPAFRPTLAQIENPDDWKSHFALRDCIRNDLLDIYGMPRNLSPTAVRALVETMKGDSTVHLNIPRKGRIEYLYDKELTTKVRKAMLEILTKGDPPAEEQKWRDEIPGKMHGVAPVMESIVDFLKESKMGTFNQYIDENGNYFESCPPDTIEAIRSIFQQLKIQKGYKDPSYMVESIQTHTGEKVSLMEIMLRAKALSWGNMKEFRDAIDKDARPVSSLSGRIFYEVKQLYIAPEGSRADWITYAEIRRKFGVTMPSPRMRNVAMRLAGDEATDHIEPRTTPNGFKAAHISPSLAKRIADEAKEQGFIKE